MNEGEVSHEVRGFIAGHVTSVVQLETLLLLAADAARAWTADQVAASLRIDPVWASSQMDGLCHQGLAARSGVPPHQYHYAPHDEPTRAAVSALAKAYLERRVTVIGLIFAPPPETPRHEAARPETPRTDGVRAFADAFRLRREKDPDKERPNG